MLEIFVANLKIPVGVNPIVCNGEHLEEPRLNFSSHNATNSPIRSHRVITAISKTGENKWRNLVNFGWLWQCNFGMCINHCYFCVRVRPKNFLSLSLSFPLIVPQWRLGRPVKTIDNSWKDEKMRASEKKCGREASGYEVEVCTFPVTHVYTWK